MVQPNLWWRDGNLHIEKFEIIDNDTILLNCDELKIDKIAAVNPGSYYRCFIYVQTKPMEPTGLYSVEKKNIDLSVENFGYRREEYGIFDGKYKVNRAEYDDGAAMINGKLVDFQGKIDLRVRYITPYNVVIAAHTSPINNNYFDEVLRKIMDGLLQGTSKIEDLEKEILNLPKLMPLS